MSPVKPDDRLTEMRLAKQMPLSAEDVVALLVDRSEDQRAITAHKVGLVYSNHPELSDKARQIGIEIFRMMVLDVAVRVREELSQTLKSSRDLPQDIAIALAKDVDSVALPFIESSLSLSDQDLIDLIDTLDEAGQKAIANRDSLTEVVAVNLVDRGHPTAVATLLDNPAAPVTAGVIDKMMTRESLQNDNQFQLAIKNRLAKLPTALGDKLKAMVSAPLQDYLTKSNRVEEKLAQSMIARSIDLGIDKSFDSAPVKPPAPPPPSPPPAPPAPPAPPPTKADELARSLHAPLVLHQLPDVGSQADVEFQVERLLSSNRLTASYILRCLTIGELLHAEVGLARLARIDIARIRTLTYDSGQLGFKAVFERARLGTEYYEIFKQMIAAIREAAQLYSATDLASRQQLVYERMMTNKKLFHPDDLDYLSKRFELLGVKTHG
ncbi:MAG: DUF2336 domain-containing protein [Candidatus Pacebacteria bacterium]|nr:DUF2336 domain-containing protein [Candidatus Paceibacterota bacterium]